MQSDLQYNKIQIVPWNNCGKADSNQTSDNGNSNCFGVLLYSCIWVSHSDVEWRMRVSRELVLTHFVFGGQNAHTSKRYLWWNVCMIHWNINSITNCMLLVVAFGWLWDMYPYFLEQRSKWYHQKDLWYSCWFLHWIKENSSGDIFFHWVSQSNVVSVR